MKKTKIYEEQFRVFQLVRMKTKKTYLNVVF